MANKIRVLLVDDNDETRDGTRRLLEYEDDLEVVDYAENGETAIEKVREHRPDVVLMDINMPGMGGLAATQRITAEFPRTQVIIVSVQDDANYMRQAIRAGAVDFVAKGARVADDLPESIRRAYNKMPAEAPSMPTGGMSTQMPTGPGYDIGMQRGAGKVIMVLGPKGGVGKTTIAVNLGIGLARQSGENRVVIVDGNMDFGDVAVFLNTRGQYSVIDMAQMCEVPEEINSQSADTIMIPHESGVKLILAPPTPAEVGAVSMASIINMLNYLKSQFDYVIVDTSTHFDDVLAGGIQVADRLIVLATPTMPAVKDSKIMFTELTGAEYPADQTLLVLNQIEKDGRVTAEQISNYLRHEVNMEIPIDPAANDALNRGAPLITADPRRSPAAKALNDLVQMVQEHLERVELEDDLSEQEQRKGLFGLGRS